MGAQSSKAGPHYSAEALLLSLEAGDVKRFLTQVAISRRNVSRVLRVRNGDTGVHVLATQGHLEGLMETMAMVLKAREQEKGSPLNAAEVARACYKVSNQTNDRGRTPLMLAAKGGHEEVVGFLLEHHANVWQRDRMGGAHALHYASSTGQDGCITLLVEHSKSHPAPLSITSLPTPLVDLGNANGLTPLHYAVWHKRHKTVALLCEHGASLYTCSTWATVGDVVPCAAGSTPLHVSALAGSARCTKAIMKAFAVALSTALEQARTEGQPAPSVMDPRLVQDRQGSLPFAVAMQRGHNRLLPYLHPFTSLEEMFADDRPEERVVGVPRLVELAAMVAQRVLLAQLEFCNASCAACAAESLRPRRSHSHHQHQHLDVHGSCHSHVSQSASPTLDAVLSSPQPTAAAAAAQSAPGTPGAMAAAAPEPATLLDLRMVALSSGAVAAAAEAQSASSHTAAKGDGAVAVPPMDASSASAVFAATAHDDIITTSAAATAAVAGLGDAGGKRHSAEADGGHQFATRASPPSAGALATSCSSQHTCCMHAALPTPCAQLDPSQVLAVDACSVPNLSHRRDSAAALGGGAPGASSGQLQEVGSGGEGSGTTGRLVGAAAPAGMLAAQVQADSPSWLERRGAWRTRLSHLSRATTLQYTTDYYTGNVCVVPHQHHGDATNLQSSTSGRRGDEKGEANPTRTSPKHGANPSPGANPRPRFRASATRLGRLTGGDGSGNGDGGSGPSRMGPYGGDEATTAACSATPGSAAAAEASPLPRAGAIKKPSGRRATATTSASSGSLLEASGHGSAGAAGEVDAGRWMSRRSAWRTMLMRHRQQLLESVAAAAVAGNNMPAVSHGCMASSAMAQSMDMSWAPAAGLPGWRWRDSGMSSGEAGAWGSHGQQEQGSGQRSAAAQLNTLAVSAADLGELCKVPLPPHQDPFNRGGAAAAALLHDVQLPKHMTPVAAMCLRLLGLAGVAGSAAADAGHAHAANPDLAATGMSSFGADNAGSGSDAAAGIRTFSSPATTGTSVATLAAAAEGGDSGGGGRAGLPGGVRQGPSHSQISAAIHMVRMHRLREGIQKMPDPDQILNQASGPIILEADDETDETTAAGSHQGAFRVTPQGNYSCNTSVRSSRAAAAASVSASAGGLPGPPPGGTAGTAAAGVMPGSGSGRSSAMQPVVELRRYASSNGQHLIIMRSSFSGTQGPGAARGCGTLAVGSSVLDRTTPMLPPLPHAAVPAPYSAGGEGNSMRGAGSSSTPPPGPLAVSSSTAIGAVLLVGAGAEQASSTQAAAAGGGGSSAAVAAGGQAGVGQVLTHVLTLLRSATASTLPGGAADKGADEGDDECCGVCLDTGTYVEVQGCSHRLCVVCAKELVRLHDLKPALCPFCRHVIMGFSPVPPRAAAGGGGSITNTQASSTFSPAMFVPAACH